MHSVTLYKYCYIIYPFFHDRGRPMSFINWNFLCKLLSFCTCLYWSDCTDGETAPASYKLVFGGVSGVFAQISCYPIDIVRRRMQTSGESYIPSLINNDEEVRVHGPINFDGTTKTCSSLLSICHYLPIQVRSCTTLHKFSCIIFNASSRTNCGNRAAFVLCSFYKKTLVQESASDMQVSRVTFCKSTYTL